MAMNSHRGTTFRSWLPFLAAAPALCALLFSLGLLLIVAVGGRSRWLDNDFNLPEAALVGDVGRVFRLLEAGQSPDATYPIRADARFKTTATMLTPTQGAVLGDNIAVLMLLFEHGAAHDPAALNAIWCLAREKNRSNVEAWLKEQRGVSPNTANCQ